MTEHIVAMCHTCNITVEASNQGLGRATIAAWLTSHQGHKIETEGVTR